MLNLSNQLCVKYLMQEIFLNAKGEVCLEYSEVMDMETSKDFILSCSRQSFDGDIVRGVKESYVNGRYRLLVSNIDGSCKLINMSPHFDVNTNIA